MAGVDQVDSLEHPVKLNLIDASVRQVIKILLLSSYTQTQGKISLHRNEELYSIVSSIAYGTKKTIVGLFSTFLRPRIFIEGVFDDGSVNVSRVYVQYGTSIRYNKDYSISTQDEKTRPYAGYSLCRENDHDWDPLGLQQRI